MTYATQADMETRFGTREVIQLTDRSTPPTGVIQSAVLAQALADADARINAYLAGRYRLPLVSAPPVLTLLACDIARYLLASHRATDEIRRRREEALRFLERVAGGQIVLVPPSQQQGVTDTGLGPQYRAAPRVFTSRHREWAENE